MSISELSINNFPSDQKPHQENSDPSPGVIIYTWPLLNSTACVCTRNLSALKLRLNGLKAKILFEFPTDNRDSQARRLWRWLKSRADIQAEAGYTFYFKIEGISKVLAELQSAWTREPTLRSASQTLKTLVRREISELCSLRHKVCVSDVVERTLKYVDGLEIERYLIWLEGEGVIKYVRKFNMFDNIISLK
jgi:hypothetical protein